MLSVVLPHYIVSKKVKRFRDIEDQANQMIELLEVGKFEGYYPKGYALAHCQVSNDPWAFFVVLQDLVDKGDFEHPVIINPRVIQAPIYKEIKETDKQIGLPREFQEPNAAKCTEGCLSFPTRRAKTLNRFDRIQVTYQIPGGLFGLKRVTKWLTGLPSQIFQHEFDHTQGQNIFFDGYKGED